MPNPKGADPKLVKQLTDQVLALHQQQAAPAGTQAAPGDLKKIGDKLKKFTPFILDGLMVIRDGQVTPDELGGLAQKVLEAFHLFSGPPA